MTFRLFRRWAAPWGREFSLLGAGGFLGLVLAAGSATGVHHATAAAAPSPSCGCQALADVSDLPLVELPVRTRGSTMAVIISGDGGWRAIDRDVAGGLRARGIPVVGLVAPDYFSTRRTPEEAACALERIIAVYAARWHMRDVIVGGYSRGAGVAPFMVNRLAPRWRAKVRALALIGLDHGIDFHVTPMDLLRTAPAPAEVPVLPEIERLSPGQQVLCFYGASDQDTLCPALPPPARGFREPGGHHMDIAYDDLAAAVWRNTRG